DWGVAKPLGALGPEAGGWPSLQHRADEASLTQPGAVVGTPRDMSPEQASGDLDRVGPASGGYGLGGTPSLLPTRRPPFPDPPLKGVLGRVRQGIFPAPRRVRRDVDPALEAICLKAMAPRPEDRHPSPLDLARALEGWLADVRYRGEQEQALNQMKGS